jgi:hypothetical protein
MPSLLNPNRPPDWRWLRVLGILNGSQPETSPDLDGQDGHAWIRRGCEFQRFLVAAIKPGAIPVSQELAALEWAHQLYRDAALRERRLLLTAYLLTGATDDAIGERFRVSAGYVSAFQELFCDVRSRLGADFYIRSVIDALVPTSDGLARKHRMWLDVAYGYGIVALDAAVSIDGIGGLQLPPNAASASPHFRRALELHQAVDRSREFTTTKSKLALLGGLANLLKPKPRRRAATKPNQTVDDFLNELAKGFKGAGGR